MFSDFKIAIAAYPKAWSLLNKNKMWPQVLLCGFIYLAILGASLFLFLQLSSALFHWAENLSWVKYCEEHFSIFRVLMKFTLVVIFITCFIFTFSWYKYILLTIASPILAYISEQTETALTGKVFPFSIAQLLVDLQRGLRISLRNLLRQSFITILLLIISFIPVVGIFSTILLIIFDSYFYGFAMLDYNYERKKLSVSDSILLIKSRPGLAVGNGLVFYGLFLVPIVGIFLGAPLSVIAATVSLHDSNK